MEEATTTTTTIVETIPLDIAKALGPIVARAVRDGRFGLMQVLCEDHEGHARFVVTDGHVMLIVDTDKPAPTDSQVFSAADVKLLLSSKGHYSPITMFASDADSTFPDYQQVVPTNRGSTDRIGFDPLYMGTIEKVTRALRLPKSAAWSCTFSGDLGPTKWEPVNLVDGITGVVLIIMPMRLD